jgi:hypothetical protein
MRKATISYHNNQSDQVTKTYLSTNTLETEFPSDFLSSTNDKFITVMNCRCIYIDYLVADVQLHVDFIERSQYMDSFCIFTNTIMTKYKKYQVLHPRRKFKIWFTDMAGHDITNLIQSFVLELMLTF